MELSKALLCYLGIVVILFLIFLRIGIYPVSSAILSLLCGQVVLNIIAPPYSITNTGDSSSGSALYTLIQVVTPLLVIIYVFVRAFEDRRPACYL